MSKPIRAILLAAGLGTRLRPLTLKKPKCLVNIGGEPLMKRWLTKLEDIGCESVIINTHYLPEQVENFVKTWKSNKMIIQTSHEEKLLGTAGTLIEHQKFFENAIGLLIHADNVMSDSVEHLVKAHRKRDSKCDLTMLTFHTESPENCGIVTVDEMGIVKSFHEKVKNPPGRCANGALYAFDSYFINIIKQMKPQPHDFSTEVIPSMIGRIQTWHTSKPYIDIGTPQALAKANQEINF
tara:strand:- start:1020 stop:1733 length:714 start_codon:yes stop_codon:yes gene_type:complete